MKENINYKLLYSIATRYYHTNNLEAAKILYEELVSNNIIPEFEFDGKHPIKYPFSLLYFHCTFAFAILHELLTYFHYDTRTI